jgi:hypothetical protein
LFHCEAGCGGELRRTAKIELRRSNCESMRSNCEGRGTCGIRLRRSNCEIELRRSNCEVELRRSNCEYRTAKIELRRSNCEDRTAKIRTQDRTAKIDANRTAARQASNCGSNCSMLDALEVWGLRSGGCSLTFEHRNRLRNRTAKIRLGSELRESG